MSVTIVNRLERLGLIVMGHLRLHGTVYWTATLRLIADLQDSREQFTRPLLTFLGEVLRLHETYDLPLRGSLRDFGDTDCDDTAVALGQRGLHVRVGQMRASSQRAL